MAHRPAAWQQPAARFSSTAPAAEQEKQQSSAAAETPPADVKPADPETPAVDATPSTTSDTPAATPTTNTPAPTQEKPGTQPAWKTAAQTAPKSATRPAPKQTVSKPSNQPKPKAAAEATPKPPAQKPGVHPPAPPNAKAKATPPVEEVKAAVNPGVWHNGHFDPRTDVDWTTSYYGASVSPVSPAQFAVLTRPIHPNDIEVKPDGVIYLPEIKYRRRLNEAFGPMGWSLIPRGEPQVGPRMVTREYTLLVGGR